MAGAFPKPDEERIRRNKPSDTGFTWTDLPYRNDKPIPPMPFGVAWSDRAKQKWDQLWSSPQSTQWDDVLATTVEKYMGLFERFWGSYSFPDDEGNTYPDLSSAVINGMTQCEDRLGLSPKAMLQLRWRVRPAPTAGEVNEPIQLAGKSKRADLRKAV